MLPNGHQDQQYAPAPSTPQSNPVGTMDGSRGVQNGANFSNLNAGFSNISLAENKSSSPAMPQFRPSLPVFRPLASLQSSGFGTQSSGASTPTSTRPAMPSFPRMPQFASPTLSTSASHPVLPTAMSQNDYETGPRAPLQTMQGGVGHAQQGQMPNSLSHPSRLNYFDQNQAQQQPSLPSSSPKNTTQVLRTLNRYILHPTTRNFPTVSLREFTLPMWRTICIRKIPLVKPINNRTINRLTVRILSINNQATGSLAKHLLISPLRPILLRTLLRKPVHLPTTRITLFQVQVRVRRFRV